MSTVEEHRAYAPATVTFAILTASDSRREAEDDSGRLISSLIEEADYRVIHRQVVADDIDAIRTAFDSALGSGADVVVLNGGTGFGPRDVSVDAVAPLLERQIEGFGELFRMLSHAQIGAAAMLSRAMAGVAGDRVVFVLPGSPKAVELAMRELILPETAHLLGQIRR